MAVNVIGNFEIKDNKLKLVKHTNEHRKSSDNLYKNFQLQYQIYENMKDELKNLYCAQFSLDKID